jgi:transposase
LPDRAELVALVLAQRAEIAELREQVAALAAELGPPDGTPTPKGMPGLKAKSVKPATDKPPRKKRPHGFARRRAEPTATVEHALDTCPDCGGALLGGSAKWRRQVIELPVVPAEVIEHVFVERQCPVCRQGRTPKADLRGVVAGPGQRLGVNLVSLIVSLREVGRLPLETIRWYLATFHQLTVSVGALVGVIQRAAKAAAGAVEVIREEVRTHSEVNADETGWREDGKNGYIWAYVTPTARYFCYGGRDKGMVDQVLGADYAGVVICDFYAAYDHLEGMKQRCWAHLLRDIADLRRLHPTDKSVARWAQAVQRLFAKAKAFSHAKERVRLRRQHAFEQQLLALCRPYLPPPKPLKGQAGEDTPAAAAEPGPAPPQRKLCARIANHLEELFVFVGDPRVPPTNNAAERAIRHLVTSRKISGGTRSSLGTRAKMTLASFFGTVRARDQNPYFALRELLLSPPL